MYVYIIYTHIIEMNKMLQQHTSINNKHLQSGNVHERSHRFCNIHTPGDGPRSGRKH